MNLSPQNSLASNAVSLPKSILIKDISSTSPYLPWSEDNINSRKVNAMKNIMTSLNYYLNNSFDNLNNYIVKDGIKLFVDTNENNYFSCNDTDFMKSNYALNINGNIVLNHDDAWSTPFNLADGLISKNGYINDSIKFDLQKSVTFTYVVAPNASNYSDDLHTYYKHMRNAVKLALHSMYNNQIQEKKHQVLIWNPFGMGAFLSTYNGPDTKEELKTKVLKILFEEYSHGSFADSTLIFVASDDFFENNTLQKITDIYNMSPVIHKKTVSFMNGDMLAVAKSYISFGTHVSVLMAADTVGPGNHFFMLPEEGKLGNARHASDENNSRRSNIIWKLFLLNMYFPVRNKGRKELFASYDVEEILSKIKIMYKTKQRFNILKVMKTLCSDMIIYL